MSNEITLAKAEFKLDLDTAGVTVVDYIPERITPPIVIINTASPYLTPSTLGNEYKMNLELVVVAATATNKQASEKLDEAIEAILLAMPRYARVLSVNEPYEMATNNANYLSANISVELEITL
jgi:enamine deaminase RidA (YjgF/YER057c/UK114 family)